MFENVMALLERLVIAAEKIADKLDQPAAPACACPPPMVEPDEPAVGDEPIEVHPVEQELAEADQAHLEREALKAELKAKGIAFKPAARTETLRKLLEESQPLAEEAAPVAPAATIEQAREALVNLSAARGKDVALKVLRSAGGADKLGEVAAGKLAAIVEMAAKEIANG